VLRPASRRYLVAKRALDLLICTLLLVVAVPLLAVCVLAIRLDSPGAALFTQERTGRDGRRFRMLKLRTMVIDAEERKAELAHLNVLPPPDFKIPDDPRITRVGRFLRATSLDELPQIFNVLRGDMSLVGPRPTSFPATRYDLWHTSRLDVPPGITGLWQLEGRNTTSFDQRLRLDVQYIRQRSVLYDMSLMARTVLAVFRRSGR
jgi:lipopolysaccharide/colanic/teichoic acid biosynthesis glycosyltransferase